MHRPWSNVETMWHLTYKVLDYYVLMYINATAVLHVYLKCFHFGMLLVILSFPKQYMLICQKNVLLCIQNIPGFVKFICILYDELYFRKRSSGCDASCFDKLFGVPVSLINHFLIWGTVLLYLLLLKVGCCSISDYLSFLHDQNGRSVRIQSILV